MTPADRDLESLTAEFGTPRGRLATLNIPRQSEAAEDPAPAAIPIRTRTAVPHLPDIDYADEPYEQIVRIEPGIYPASVVKVRIIDRTNFRSRTVEVDCDIHISDTETVRLTRYYKVKGLKRGKSGKPFTVSPRSDLYREFFLLTGKRMDLTGSFDSELLIGFRALAVVKNVEKDWRKQSLSEGLVYSKIDHFLPRETNPLLVIDEDAH